MDFPFCEKPDVAVITYSHILDKKAPMEMIIAPTHIERFCIDDEQDLHLQALRKKYCDDFHFVYKVKCTCGNEEFNLTMDRHPSMYAECSSCRQKLVIYDRALYPASCKLDRQFELEQVTTKPTKAYVCYEYSDEYLYEEDVPFDNNDITGALAFVEQDDDIVMMLNDETA